MATPEAPAASAPAERRHGLTIFAIWLPLAVIADLLIWFAWKPHMPPGTMSSSAEGSRPPGSAPPRSSCSACSSSARSS